MKAGTSIQKVREVPFFPGSAIIPGIALLPSPSSPLKGAEKLDFPVWGIMIPQFEMLCRKELLKAGKDYGIMSQGRFNPLSCFQILQCCKRGWWKVNSLFYAEWIKIGIFPLKKNTTKAKLNLRLS